MLEMDNTTGFFVAAAITVGGVLLLSKFGQSSLAAHRQASFEQTCMNAGGVVDPKNYCMKDGGAIFPQESGVSAPFYLEHPFYTSMAVALLATRSIGGVLGTAVGFGGVTLAIMSSIH